MLGTILHPAAHNFSADLRQILKAAGPASLAELPQKTHVPVPITLVAAVAAILSTLPGTRVGRPPKASTVEALKLAKEIKSNHGVAKLVAAITGEDPGKIRSNLRGLKKRSKKRRTKH